MMEKIPTDELLADLGEVEFSIHICKVALNIGAHRARFNQKLIGNIETKHKIITELEDRAFAGEQIVTSQRKQEMSDD